MRFLKQNTATRITVGPFLDKTDGITPKTALTVTNCHLTLMVDDGGVPTLVLDAAPTASGGNNDMVHVTGDDAGFYDLELTAAQLNYVGRAMLAIMDAANHCPVFHEFMILPAKVYDSLVGGTDNLEVDTIQVGGTNQTARDIGASVLLSAGTGAGQLDFTAGVVKSNLTQMGGVAQSATDLKDFADTGYDPATHKVQGVVLTDTVTTYTGNTPQTGDAYAIVNHGTYGNSAIRTRGDAAWITATGFATSAALATVAGYVDTEVQAILDIVGNATYGNAALRARGDAAWITATGFSTPSDITALSAHGDTNWHTATGFSTHSATDVWAVATRALTDKAGFSLAADQAVNVSKINGSSTAAERLALSAASIVSGSAISGTLSTTQMTTDLTESTDDHYNGRIVIFTSGVLANQASNITDYDGTTKKLTFTATTEAPAPGDPFIIV